MEQIMSEQIMWMTPGRIRGKARRANEVSVKESHIQNKQYTDIWFYGNSFRKITKKDFVNIGLTAERIYFDEAQTTWYKLCISKSKTSARVRLRGLKEKFIGEHDLKFDPEYKLWYIGK